MNIVLFVVVMTYETYENYIEQYQNFIFNDFLHLDYYVKIMNQFIFAYTIDKLPKRTKHIYIYIK